MRSKCHGRHGHLEVVVKRQVGGGKGRGNRGQYRKYDGSIRKGSPWGLDGVRKKGSVGVKGSVGCECRLYRRRSVGLKGSAWS